jgi:hypothetical protein
LRKPQPAWSSAFSADALRMIDPVLPTSGLDEEWAMRTSTGTAPRAPGS